MLRRIGPWIDLSNVLNLKGMRGRREMRRKEKEKEREREEREEVGEETDASWL